MVKGNPTAKVQTNSEFKKSAAAQMDTFLNIVYAMLAVCRDDRESIGIVNTLALSIMERTRSFGPPACGGHYPHVIRLRIEALLIACSRARSSASCSACDRRGASSRSGRTRR